MSSVVWRRRIVWDEDGIKGAKMNVELTGERDDDLPQGIVAGDGCSRIITSKIYRRRD